VVIEIEQQVVPTLVVSHVSILQCLMAYFRNSPVDECIQIEVPMHTVIKFTPVRGGGWSESQHPLFDDSEVNNAIPSPPLTSYHRGVISVESSSEVSALGDEEVVPIWGDGQSTYRKPLT
jgi:hypothetical protein